MQQVVLLQIYNN